MDKRKDDTRERIQGYLDRSALTGARPRVVPLTPDASDRRYFRILLPDAPSIVLSLYSAPFDVTALPFVNVATLMAKMPVPIPAVLGHADDLGVLALQDLGDVTLQAHLGAASPSQHAALYRQAVALIATLQKRGQELASPDYLPYGISFDVEKLTWELDFFTKHFLEAYRGVTLADDQRAELREEYATIVQELAAEPRVLCHRDYHSRNLMLFDGQLYLIDFQDARMGPDTYDLVSLLRDSYVDLTDQTVEESDRLLPGAEGHAGRCGLPPAVQYDGAAAQPESARHVRLPDDRARQPRLHPVHPAHAALCPPQPGAAPLRRDCASCSAAHVEEFR